MAAGRWRRFVVRPLVWLLAALALAAFGIWRLLDSDLARARVRDFLEGRLAEALGRAVAIERVEFELVPPTLVLHGLTIAGDRPGAPPFATLARGEVTADLGDLGASIVTLRRVELDGLDLRLEFHEGGGDNLPRLHTGGGRGTQVVLGGLAIADSRLHLDHRVVPLELTALAIQARLVGAGERGLDGSFAAQEVSLTLPDARPVALAIAGRARLEGDRLELHNARVTGPDLLVAVDGEIGLARGGSVRLDTRATARAELLDRLGWLDGELAGAVEFAGEVAWSPADWQVAGRLTSPRLAVVDFDLSELAGDARVTAAGAELAIERGRWAEGSVAGSFAVRFAPGYPARLELTLADVDLDAALARFEVPVQEARGRLRGPLLYEFDLLAAARGRGRGDFVVAGEPAGDGMLAADGEVGVELADGRVALSPIVWRAAGQRVDGSGEIDLESGAGELRLAVASEDLGALVARLPFLTPGEPWLPTSGTGELDVGIRFDRAGYAVDLDFAAAALVAPGLAAERARGRVRVDPRRARLERLELERGAARLRLAGEIPLVASAPPMELALEVVDWPFADAVPWLPVALPVTGDVRGSLLLRGDPASPGGAADLVLSPAELGGIAARRLAARLEWDATRLVVHAARADFDAGGVEATGTLRFADEALDFAIASPALALERAPLAWSDSPALAGRLALDARVGGTLAAPSLTVAATASDATLAGAPLAAGAVGARVDWRDGRLAAEIDLGGEARLTGGGELVPERAARLEFELTSPRLDRLVALATGGAVADLEGELAADIVLDWPAGAPPRAEIRVPTLELAWRGQFLRSLEPLVAYVDGTRLRLASVYLGAAERDADELFVGGTVDFGDDPRLDLHLQAALDAAWVEPFLAGVDVSGRVDLLATLRGSVARPEWSGQAAWSDGRLLPPTLPHTLEHGRALLLIYPNALVLDRLRGDFAGGSLEASGRLALRDGVLGAYRFEAAGRRLNLRWPSGWQLRGDADLTLLSTASGRAIGGAVELDRAYYFQDIDLSPAELVQRLLSRSPVLVPETDELLASTALDVAVRVPGGLRVRNNIARLDGSAELAVRGSLARPVVFGDVVMGADSRVEYGGATYRLDRGVLTFANPTRIDPLLDVVAATRVQEYDVRLQLSGPLSRPVTTFSSDPPLPDLEILGLLTTGAPLESGLLSESDPSGTEGSASVAAEALLYGQAASLVGARVGRIFGFDRIRVEPLTANDTVSAARVTVGKRISSRLFVTYSYDPSSTAQDIIQVEWQLSDRLQLVLTQNGDESYAVDARWEKRF
jgi:autotransporter translocation and assembly factor TamB